MFGFNRIFLLELFFIRIKRNNEIKNGVNIKIRKGPFPSLPPKDLSQIPGNKPWRTAMIK